ncbi:pteridine reductase [Neptuniibacter sp. CAU 1671]|uniref:pteridine reductase n=1 Tax=Neptuniibacter sp. CAU 1671 TaxID=3032593 RepID=UPI0023DA99EC|nr:pteridine reductase [Neptuniibacter sp. CAU 1671]MDF2181428.1 pteridine reductase [Neptuniibacter sp. CAU 1671]
MVQHPAKVALITGAARRVGATLAKRLHSAGYNIVLHYNHSADDAERLAAELNQQRSGSVCLIQADLNDMQAVQSLAVDALASWERIDLLINNASAFYPTPLTQSSQDQWDELINSNLRAPYFLCAALADALTVNHGNIINLIDIHAQRGLPGYPIYSIAKAGLQMLTYSLAKELAPNVRVNGVSPGPILWPENAAAQTEAEQTAILEKTLLKRTGSADDLADAVLYLSQAGYVTGQVIAVDGGKSLYSH